MSRKSKPAPLLAQHHARPPQRITNAASANAAFKAINEAWGPNLIDAVEKQMSAILIRAGLPTTPAIGRELSPRHIVSGLDRLALHHGHSVGSAVWYAGKILEQIADVRRVLAVGDKDKILHHAMYLGVLLQEANTVVRHGPAIDMGLKQYPRMRGLSGDANEARKRRATTKHKRWIAEAKQLWQRNPLMSAARCGKLVIKKLSLAEKLRTVRRVIACVQPK